MMIPVRSKTAPEEPMLKCQNSFTEREGVSSRFAFIRKRGCGYSGVVEEAHDRATDQVVALKFIDLATRQRSEAELYAEALPAALHHPNIVKVFEVHVTKTCLMLVMECMDCTLLEYKLAHAPVSEDTARPIVQKIAQALGFCHKNRIVIRDVKLTNILLADGAERVKLCDFGLAKDVCQSSAKTILGTPAYVAPEVIGRWLEPSEHHRGYDAEAADVWSLGVICFELLKKDLPYHPIRVDNFKCVSPAFGEHNVDYSNLSHDCKDLLQGMLRSDPVKRLTVNQVLQHVWFAALPDSRSSNEALPLCLGQQRPLREVVDKNILKNVQQAALLSKELFHKALETASNTAQDMSALGVEADDKEGAHAADQRMNTLFMESSRASLLQKMLTINTDGSIVPRNHQGDDMGNRSMDTSDAMLVYLPVLNAIDGTLLQGC